jgi:hypothetical protein
MGVDGQGSRKTGGSAADRIFIMRKDFHGNY